MWTEIAQLVLIRMERWQALAFVVNGTSTLFCDAFETFVVGIDANIDLAYARRKLIASIQTQFRWPRGDKIDDQCIAECTLCRAIMAQLCSQSSTKTQGCILGQSQGAIPTGRRFIGCGKYLKMFLSA